MNSEAQLREQLNKFRRSRTTILGIGSILKGDDATGPQLCARLSGKTSAEVIDAGTVPENYIAPIVKKAPENLLIVDAVDFGASPGTIRIFAPDALSSLTTSTHTPSPRLFIDTLRHEIPVDVHIVAIQPAQTAMGRPLSPQVARAVSSLADMLAEIFPAEN